MFCNRGLDVYSYKFDNQEKKSFLDFIIKILDLFGILCYYIQVKLLKNIQLKEELEYEKEYVDGEQ